jgi:hypothetical protein
MFRPPRCSKCNTRLLPPRSQQIRWLKLWRIEFEPDQFDTQTLPPLSAGLDVFDLLGRCRGVDRIDVSDSPSQARM